MSAKTQRLRRTRQKSSKNSPTFVANVNRQSDNSIVFEFQCESMSGSLSSMSSVCTESGPERETRKKKTKKSGRRKIRGSSPQISFTACNETSNNTPDLEVSLKKSKVKAKKSNRNFEEDCSVEICPSLKGTFKKSNSAENFEASIVMPTQFITSGDKICHEKKTCKKKIRNTQDLMFFASEDSKYSEACAKSKSKKTKKAKIPSFLPTVENILEAKTNNENLLKEKNCISSGNTTSSDNKENESVTDSTDIEEKPKRKKGHAKGGSKNPKSKKKIVSNNYFTSDSEVGSDDVFELEKVRTRKLVSKSPFRQIEESVKEVKSVDLEKSQKIALKKTDAIGVSEMCDNEDMRTRKSFKKSSIEKNCFGSDLLDNTKDNKFRGKSFEVKYADNKLQNSAVINVKTLKKGLLKTKSKLDTLKIEKSLIKPTKTDEDLSNSKRNTFEIEVTEDVQMYVNVQTNSEKTGKKSQALSRSKRNTVNMLPDRETTAWSDSSSETGEKSAETLDIENTPNKRTSKINASLAGPSFKSKEDLMSSRRDTFKIKPMEVLQACQDIQSKRRTFESNENRKGKGNAVDILPNLENNLTDSSTVLRKETGQTSFQKMVSKQETSEVETAEKTLESIAVKNSKRPKKSSLKRTSKISTSLIGQDFINTKIDKDLADSRINTFEIEGKGVVETDENSQIKRRTFEKSPKKLQQIKNEDDQKSSDENNTPISEEKMIDSDLLDCSNSRKSSLEVVFKAKKRNNDQIKSSKRSGEEILDHLNITRRDSSKNVQQKSGNTFKLSSDAEDEPKQTFVNLKRGCRTMIDMDTRTSWQDFNDYSPVEGALKKFKNVDDLTDEWTTKEINRSENYDHNDTFQIAERFYEVLESARKNNEKPDLPIADNIEGRDIFKVIQDMQPSDTLIDLGTSRNGTADMLVTSLCSDETVDSGVPILTRTLTFTLDKSNRESPQTRKSTRKRWSQVERTPLLGDVGCDQNSLKMDLNKERFDTSKSIATPSRKSPRKRWQSSINLNDSRKESTLPIKKTVTMKTPVHTPKMKLHTPLHIRKTPKPAFNGSLLGDISYQKTRNTPKPKPLFRLSPPSSSSTPFTSQKESSLLKKVLTNEKSKADKILGKNSARTKMPDFAKIHQRRFEKMENLKEMQERKAMRAQYLLSGSKPPASTSLIRERTTENEPKKKLQFSPSKNQLKSKGVVKSPEKPSISKAVSKPKTLMMKKRASLEKKKKQMKSKVPVPIKQPTPVSKVEVMEVKKPFVESKGLTRFGFKLPSKENLTKEEQIKAVSSKSKIVLNVTENSRKKINGVRSNRRFELLMKMRQNEK